jgi:hypothetical protein
VAVPEHVLATQSPVNDTAVTGPEPDSAAFVRLKASALVETWARKVARLSSLLRSPPPDGGFGAALAALDAECLSLIRHDTDRLLFVATFSADGEPERYAAAHALLVAICCELAARVLPGWDDDQCQRLRRVAMTMNIAMIEQQDQMARQSAPLSAPQRELVEQHAALGAEKLQGLGVDDPDWLAAVAQHHGAPPGPLAGRDAAGRIARLVQRADIHTAALSRRGLRDPLAPAKASRNAYLDENEQPDECGAALIKVLGIYPPGTLVRLANGEVAVVLRRGQRADQPRALAVVREDGMPHTTPKVRNTANADAKVVGSLTRSDINLRLTLERLVAVEP